MEKKDPIQFAIEQAIAVLGDARGGWKLELNRVSWNGRDAKYDLRTWDPEHQQMGKGITLTADEAQKLREALDAHFGSK